MSFFGREPEPESNFWVSSGSGFDSCPFLNKPLYNNTAEIKKIGQRICWCQVFLCFLEIWWWLIGSKSDFCGRNPRFETGVFHNDSQAQCSILRPLLKGIIIFKLMLFDLLLGNYRSRRPCRIAPFFENAGVEPDPNKVGTPRCFSEIPIYS